MSVAVAGAALPAPAGAQAPPQIPAASVTPTPEPEPPGQLRVRAGIARQHLAGPDRPASPMFRLTGAGSPAAGAGGFPVFRGRQGDPFSLEIENMLEQPTAFHLRGLRGPNADDGMPGLTTRPLAPGAKLVLPVDTRQPGTFFLAPVLARHAPEQNARGLHAAVIVEERDPPPFDHDLVLAVSDWRLDDHGLMAQDFSDLRDVARIGRLGNRLVANGAPAPGAMTVRPGARLRIRMINVSNARMIPLKVSGFEARVYSIDSTPCQPFDPLKRTVVMAPSTRIELVLDAPAEPGRDGAIEAKLGNGIPIFTFRTEGAPFSGRGGLVALPDPGLPPAIRLQDAARADIRIAGGVGLNPAESLPEALRERFRDPGTVYSINGGTGGFAGNPVLKVRRGREIVFAIFNDTAWPQVVAVHGHCFRLLHAFDDGWEPYFLDTLYLAGGSVARVAFIADNPGKWAIRSTVAEHYAAGVSTWFEVT